MPAIIAPPKSSSQAPPPVGGPSSAGGAAPPVTPAAPDRAAPPAEHERSTGDYLSDITKDLNELADQGDASREEGTRDSKGRFVKPEKAVEAPKKEEVAPEVQKTEEPRPGSMKALSKAYDEMKKEVNDNLRPSLQKLTSERDQLKSQLEQLQKSAPDPKPLQAELEATRKENQSLREAIRYVDYSKSPEFRDKYVTPYEDAWKKAVTEVSQLTLQLEDGTARKATANDLLALANAPLDQIDELAEKWFPKSSARVIRHVEKIRDLSEAQQRALDEAKQGAETFTKTQREQMEKASQSFRSTYDSANTELPKRYPKWFAEDQADKPGNELLKKGLEFADSVFSQNGNLTPEQRAGRLAVVRWKAGNHDRLAKRLRESLNAQVELEKKLAQYEDSEPPTTSAAGEPTPSGNGYGLDYEKELGELAAKGR